MRLPLPFNYGGARSTAARVAALAAKYNAPYWLPRPETCWADVSGTPAVEGSLVKILLDERYKGRLGPALAPALANFNSTGSPALPATLTSTINGNFGLYKSGFYTVGKLYRVEVTWSGNTNSRNVAVDTPYTFFGNGVSGTATRYISATSAQIIVYLVAATIGETITFSSISIKEVLGHNAVAGTSAASMILRKNLNRAPMVSPTTGETWTFNGTHIANRSGIAWDADGVPYLQCSGAVSNYASTPDTAAVSVTGNITLVCKVRLAEFPPSITRYIIGKFGAATTKSYSLNITETTGVITLLVSADGTTSLSFSSTAVPGFVVGNAYWIKATLQLTNGTNSVVEFFTSLDGVTWTKLGNTVLGAPIASLYDGATAVEIGSAATGNSPWSDRIYYAAIYNNAAASGVPVAEFNPSAANVYRPTEYYLDGDGAATFYSVPSALGLLRNVAGSTLVVAQQEFGTGLRCHLEVNTNSANSRRNTLQQESSDQYSQGIRRLDAEGIAIRNSAIAPINSRLVASSRTDYTNGLAYLRVNNVAASTLTLTSAGNTSDTDSYAVSIGAIQTGLTVGTGWSNGPFSAAMICPALMIEAEVKVVERYFGSKNGVTI